MEGDTPTEKIELDELLKQLHRQMSSLENEVVRLTTLHVSVLDRMQAQEDLIMKLIGKLKKHAVLADILRDI